MGRAHSMPVTAHSVWHSELIQKGTLGASVMIEWVKVLCVVPASDRGTGSCPGCSTYVQPPLMALESSGRWLVLVPMWETCRRLVAVAWPRPD